MPQSNGACIIAISVPEDSEEPIQSYKLKNPHGKNKRKLPKEIYEQNGHNRESTFINALKSVPVDNPLVYRDYSAGYVYSRATSSGSRGIRSVKTHIHAYVVLCRPNDVLDGNGFWSDCVDDLSYDYEIDVVSDAVDHVSDNREDILTEMSKSVDDTPTYERAVLTPGEVRDSRSFTYGWNVWVEDPADQPWLDTEPEFGDVYTKKEIQKAIRGGSSTIGNVSTGLFCHNLGCEEGDSTKEIGAEAVLNMVTKASQSLSVGLRKKLESMGTDRVEFQYNSVPDGFVAYLLVGPSSDDELEVSGWFCSPECIESAEWPTDDHIAVAVELEVNHPPDVYRHSQLPSVAEVKGVYCTEPDNDSNSDGLVSVLGEDAMTKVEKAQNDDLQHDLAGF